MTTTTTDQRIDLVLTAIDPIHHGAGTSGNTAILRTQPIVLPDGRRAAVPYVSGNSVRHTIRDALAWHLIRALGVGDGDLTTGQVALLFSGGALSEPGAKVNLDRLRRAGQLLPHLTMMGYSARNDIATSTLRVGHVHLVCAENTWRMPPHLADHPHASMPAGAFRDENFGTRHDPTGGPTDRLLAESGMFDTASSSTPTQMIYDFQVLRPGSVLWTGFWLEAATELETDAFATGLAHATADNELILGARRAVGYGRCKPQTIGGDNTLNPERVERYTQHIRDNATEIRALLTELVG